MLLKWVEIQRAVNSVKMNGDSVKLNDFRAQKREDSRLPGFRNFQISNLKFHMFRISINS